MSPAEKRLEIPERVEQEHQNLRKALDALQSFSRVAPASEEFAQWRLELIWRVRDFKNDLLKHFDLEEEGGFMRDVRRLVPNSNPQIKSLLEEHKEMERSMDQILASLKAMHERDEQALTRLQEKIEEFARTILDHETTEQHLLQRSYYRDYGGPE